ncbi:MAG: hypothetical protein ACE5G7_05715 [Candidatus Hydrothermarchaeaceae archaeon]
MEVMEMPGVPGLPVIIVELGFLVVVVVGLYMIVKVVSEKEASKEA